MLNTIAKNQLGDFISSVSGIPHDWNKSNYNYKIKAVDSMKELLNIGFVDVYRIKNKKKQEYTFWDYFAGSWQKNYGMRIDHFLLSNNLIENISSININKKPRSKLKPSDHTPIELVIN